MLPRSFRLNIRLFVEIKSQPLLFKCPAPNFPPEFKWVSAKYFVFGAAHQQRCIFSVKLKTLSNLLQLSHQHWGCHRHHRHGHNSYLHHHCDHHRLWKNDVRGARGYKIVTDVCLTVTSILKWGVSSANDDGDDFWWWTIRTIMIMKNIRRSLPVFGDQPFS